MCHDYWTQLICKTCGWEGEPTKDENDDEVLRCWWARNNDVAVEDCTKPLSPIIQERTIECSDCKAKREKKDQE